MKKNGFIMGIMSIALVFVLLAAGCSSSPEAAPGPDLSTVTSYYVRADGNDKNNGISEDTPFKTLGRAVEAAAKTPVKKITVIGTLIGFTDIEDIDPTPKKVLKFMDATGGRDFAEVMKKGQGTAQIEGSYDEPDPEEILITGKPGATEGEKAVLKYRKGDEGILGIIGGTVRFENIEISGRGEDGAYALFLGFGVLTLAKGTVVTNNTGSSTVYGLGGIIIMRDDASVFGNAGKDNVGVYLSKGSVLIMRDESSIRNNNAENNGGGVAMEGSSVIMMGNARIANNIAGSAGGGIVTFADEEGGYIPQIIMRENTAVTGNAAAVGGGILLQHGELGLEDNAQITGNTASDIGGGLFTIGEDVKVYKSRTALLSGNTAPAVPDSEYDFN